MKSLSVLSLALGCLLVILPFQDGDLYAAKKKKGKKGGTIPDLTKGEAWEEPEAKGPHGHFGFFNLGPTGLMGFMIGGQAGSQIQVKVVLNNSPASGKFKVGDVILGINGKKFEAGGDLADVFGAAINEAEKTENNGKMKFMVWRDKNFSKRSGAVDMANLDVDDAFTQTEEDVEGAVFNWLDKAGRKKAVDNMLKVPMDPVDLNISINIPVLGSFKDSSPYECEKSKQIVERGLKLVRKNFKKSKGFGRYFMKAHVLLATGNKDDLELVKAKVRKSKAFSPDRKISTWGFFYGSWYSGYQLVFGSEYYMRTGDDYILPALKEIATKTAMGQTYGGTWSHSFSARSFNMGKVNMRASGYGAMNQAGGPCFLGIVMAQKCGITNVHIEKAIKNSSLFYGAISELGATHYGVHGVANYADSNGKNGPPAFAFKLLGRTTDAQYFAWCQGVAAKYGHGGHNGGEWGAIWRTLGAALGGPLAVQDYHKNRRNWYAMGRRHDGGWLLHWPSGGPFFRDDSTALNVLRHMSPLGNTYLTGKDPMKECILTKDTLQHIKDGNIGKENYPTYLASLSNEQLIYKLRTFYPVMRDRFAKELGTRYKAGKAKGLVEKILPLLKDKEPRTRAGAVLTIAECGEDVAKKYVKQMLSLFDDPRQFVRINAIRAIGKHFKTLEEEVVEPMMQLVTRKEYWYMINDNNNVPTYVFNLLYQQPRKNEPGFKPYDLAGNPFEEGYNPKLTRTAMERGFQWDPGRGNLLKTVSRKWEREQVVDMAGPIIYGAEFLQYNDMMFAGGAISAGRAVLKKHNLEYDLLNAVSYDLHLLDNLPRNFYPKANGHDRAMGGKTPFDGFTVNDAKGGARFLLPKLKKYLVREPLWKKDEKDRNGKVLRTVHLLDIIKIIENDKSRTVGKSIQEDVDALFSETLNNISGKDAKIKYCRSWLNWERKTYFRQISAMTELVKLAGTDAIKDLVPFLNHENWRWREHSRKLVANLGKDATATVMSLYKKEENVSRATGLMASLIPLKDPAAAEFALQAMAIADDEVKGQAVQVLVASSGFENLEAIINVFKTVEDDHGLDGYEKALLMCKGNKEEETKVANMLIKNIMKSRSAARNSIYYVLAQIGGEKILGVLARVSRAKSEVDFKNVVNAVSYSRDPKTEAWLISILKENEGTRRTFVVADACVRRMVISSKGIAKNDPDRSVRFARAVLKYVKQTNIIRLLGYIPTADSAELMFEYMRKGPAKVTAAASESIIECSERFDPKASLEERKRVAATLRNVIEYLTVTELRIPEEERGSKRNNYYGAKKMVDKAGKLMGKLYDPANAVIDDIDDDDLDI